MSIKKRRIEEMEISRKNQRSFNYYIVICNIEISKEVKKSRKNIDRHGRTDGQINRRTVETD